MKGVMKFVKKGKRSPRYVGPYRILKRIGKVVYELDLPADLVAVHQVFHISRLKKCVGDPTSIVPLEIVAVNDCLSYEDVLVEILDRQVRRLRNEEVASVKVLWRSQSVEGATWEVEVAMKGKYPHLFLSIPLQLETRLQISSVAGVIHGHHLWTVEAPTVLPAGPWFVSANSPRTQREIWPSVDPRPDLWSIGQVTDCGSCPWIDAPKAQLQSRWMVDQHRPSFDARLVDLITRLQISGVAVGIHGHHLRTVGAPTVSPADPWFVSAISPRTQPKIRPSVDPRPDLPFVGQVTDCGSCPWINAPKAQVQSRLMVD
ncbi:hypothetical protein MTR67_031225 [Solanum verrucosum]|uniref:Tf2-1-like SH3-like domain-containing protein n=1 Tax=Solanum verrucosum TaxID=315347 RepID=A0AAF0U211_SOLVR|nr:hypothetical protein MTR67_031225 [Solanum verrucosum]